MDPAIFYQLSIVIAIAAVLSLILRLLRQPLVIGYIVTGFLIGPSLLNVIRDQGAFDSFSQIGVVLLLFIIGLGLNVGIIKATGKPVFVAFVAIIAGVGSIGLVASHLLGFSSKEAVVMAAALLFSSTIIVIKSLSDKKEQSRLYGQIAIGVLLVEDIAATMALVLVSASGSDATTSNDLIYLAAKGVGLAAGLVLVGGYVMPRISKLFAPSQELLYVFALAWAFGVASLFRWAGFSIEVGALFAGVALAHIPYVQAIASKLKPLRDFFIVLFFIHLGEELGVSHLSSALVPALIFSAIIMVSKPLLTMMSLGLLGYTKQTSFKTAVHLSQISEFSIVLIVVAAGNGLVSQDLVAVVTLTALITIALSAYLMKYDDQLYAFLQRPLGIFERRETKNELKALGHYSLLLLGYHEGGHNFVKTFKQMKKRYVVIDYDPDVIELLEDRHINHLYGDVTDVELLEEIGIHRSELIVSTLASIDTNVMLAAYITKANHEAIFVCPAQGIEEAEKLYKAGASYVLLPHYIGDEHINNFLKRNGSNKRAFDAYRRQHLEELDRLSSTVV